jgi:ribonuclease Z
MGYLQFLGSSNFVPDKDHGNTHMLISEGDCNILIDCSGDIVQRIQAINLPFDNITDIILTHFHPDHVAGAPLLLMGMWIMGRKRPLNLYAIPHTSYRIQAVMDFYEWQTWPHFYPVIFNQVEEKEFAVVMNSPEFFIQASPVKHFIPTIGLRVEFAHSGKSFCYSCDTEPCPQVVRLAKYADILIHESTGAQPGHTSSVQAAEIANQAEVGELYLIHYQDRGTALEKMLSDAQKVFKGPVKLVQDFMKVEF